MSNDCQDPGLVAPIVDSSTAVIAPWPCVESLVICQNAGAMPALKLVGPAAATTMPRSPPRACH